MDDKPQQYIRGWVEFFKLRFKVTPDVLIPRPETELLVDAVLEFARDCFSPKGLRNDVIARSEVTKQSLTILDLGTGSGNIAISLAKNLPAARLPDRQGRHGLPPTLPYQIIATDVSSDALKIAQQNAKLHQVADKITFLTSNLLSSVGTSPDIIVTNLPYIPSERIPYLDSSVKDFEPHVALDGGEDGFELYRQLFQQVKDRGWKPKLILGEIDYTHGELAQNEAQKYFPETEVEVKTDLAHKQRILSIKTSL